MKIVIRNYHYESRMEHSKTEDDRNITQCIDKKVYTHSAEESVTFNKWVDRSGQS